MGVEARVGARVGARMGARAGIPVTVALGKRGSAGAIVAIGGTVCRKRFALRLGVNSGSMLC